MLADVVTQEVLSERKVNYGIAPLLVDRWSPRSMTGEPMVDEEIFPLFEAARWAPSSYNCQLWRFIMARRQNREEFERFFSLLTPGNQVWTKKCRCACSGGLADTIRVQRQAVCYALVRRGRRVGEFGARGDPSPVSCSRYGGVRLRASKDRTIDTGRLRCERHDRNRALRACGKPARQIS